MGCDIHPMIEWLDHEPRKGEEPWWHVYATGDLGIPRYYVLFGALAGVRARDAEPVAEPRGLPEHASWEAKQSMEHCDFHSHSWLTLEECEEASRRVISAAAEHDVTRSGLEGVIAILRHLKESGHSARFVFWFDN